MAVDGKESLNVFAYAVFDACGFGKLLKSRYSMINLVKNVAAERRSANSLTNINHSYPQRVFRELNIETAIIQLSFPICLA